MKFFTTFFKTSEKSTPEEPGYGSENPKYPSKAGGDEEGIPPGSVLLPLLCPKCQHPVCSSSMECSNCRALVHAVSFPARMIPAIPERELSPNASEQAVCFYHDRSPAANVCSECGRFICSACDSGAQENSILCRVCETLHFVHTGHQHFNIVRWVHYDTIAFLCAALSLLPNLTFVFAPLCFATLLRIQRWKDKPNFSVAITLGSYGLCVFLIYIRWP